MMFSLERFIENCCRLMHSVRVTRVLQLAVTSCIAVLALAAPAIAQETGTLIQHRAAQMDEGRSTSHARSTLRQYGACVLDRYKGRVARMMAIAVDSDEYHRLSRAIVEGDGDACLSGGELSFGSAAFKAALFEAVYMRDFRFQEPDAIPPDLSSGYAALYQQPYSAEARNALALEQFGECVVRADARTARAVVLSDPGTSVEQDAFARVAPALGGCMPKGEKMELSKAIVRGAVAEALYRLSVAMRAGKTR